MQTVSFEDARLVATMCQRSENCPLGQVPWKGLFSNCYVTGRVLFRWGPRGGFFSRTSTMRSAAWPSQNWGMRPGFPFPARMA